MNVLLLVRAHTAALLLDLRRSPSYVIPTVFFPAMFFTIFAMPYARHRADIADFELLSFVAFAIVGVTLFQFGVGIAAERGRPWERYLRTLPCPAWVRFVARVACAMVFGLIAAAMVAIVAKFTTPVDLNAVQWLQVGWYGLLGGIPFVLFGIARPGAVSSRRRRSGMELARAMRRRYGVLARTPTSFRRSRDRLSQRRARVPVGDRRRKVRHNII